LLLIGEPGLGKSQFLKYAASLDPRHILTSGAGTSSAGLTVAALKEPGGGGEWVLEAGALVLADGGVCCIDELTAMSSADRTAIHEAMEQQRISVAKAGMITELHTRAAVIAATNPKGKYDADVALSVNVALDPPLLSRFDLILLLLDPHDKEWDEKLASFVLQEHAAAPRTTESDRKGTERQSSSSNNNNNNNNNTGTAPTTGDDVWDIEKLRAYVLHVRTLQPALSGDARAVLQRYYSVQRNNQARTGVATVRQLESLVRLAQAHARLMLRPTVTLQDAVVAIELTEASALSSSFVDKPPSLLAGFVNNPDEMYYEFEEKVLTKMQLDDVLESTRKKIEALPPPHGHQPTTKHTQQPAPVAPALSEVARLRSTLEQMSQQRETSQLIESRKKVQIEHDVPTLQVLTEAFAKENLERVNKRRDEILQTQRRTQNSGVALPPQRFQFPHPQTQQPSPQRSGMAPQCVFATQQQHKNKQKEFVPSTQLTRTSFSTLLTPDANLGRPDLASPLINTTQISATESKNTNSGKQNPSIHDDSDDFDVNAMLGIGLPPARKTLLQKSQRTEVLNTKESDLKRRRLFSTQPNAPSKQLPQPAIKIEEAKQANQSLNVLSDLDFDFLSDDDLSFLPYSSNTKESSNGLSDKTTQPLVIQTQKVQQVSNPKTQATSLIDTNKNLLSKNSPLESINNKINDTNSLNAEMNVCNSTKISKQSQSNSITSILRKAEMYSARIIDQQKSSPSFLEKDENEEHLFDDFDL
jgi:Mg-chelatase subunit ChlI